MYRSFFELMVAECHNLRGYAGLELKKEKAEDEASKKLNRLISTVLSIKQGAIMPYMMPK